jgi:hypothetical protein
VDGCEELFLMIELADYYQCLPILSYSMDGALLNSPKVTDEIWDDPHKSFDFAAKLGNANLFRDFLINIVNPWSWPFYLKLSGPKFRKAAQPGYNSVARKVAVAHCMVTNSLSRSYPVHLLEPKLQFLVSAAKSTRDVREQYSINYMPMYYRTLYDREIL